MIQSHYTQFSHDIKTSLFKLKYKYVKPKLNTESHFSDPTDRSINCALKLLAKKTNFLLLSVLKPSLILLPWLQVSVQRRNDMWVQLFPIFTQLVKISVANILLWKIPGCSPYCLFHLGMRTRSGEECCARTRWFHNTALTETSGWCKWHTLAAPGLGPTEIDKLRYYRSQRVWKMLELVRIKYTK